MIQSYEKIEEIDIAVVGALNPKTIDKRKSISSLM